MSIPAGGNSSFIDSEIFSIGLDTGATLLLTLSITTDGLEGAAGSVTTISVTLLSGLLGFNAVGGGLALGFAETGGGIDFRLEALSLTSPDCVVGDLGGGDFGDTGGGDFGDTGGGDVAGETAGDSVIGDTTPSLLLVLGFGFLSLEIIDRRLVRFRFLFPSALASDELGDVGILMTFSGGLFTDF